MRNLSSAIVVATLGCAAAPAAELHVDASAPNHGDGSRTRPFNRLQAGIDAARPGDTLRVRAGTYDPIKTVRDGTHRHRIAVVAEQRREVIVQANGRALDAAHTHHSFRGIVFDSGYGPGQVIRTNGADHLELVDIEARRGTANCIALGTVRHVLIADSTIHHCINHFSPDKNVDSHGITGGSVIDLTVENTEIYLVTGDAIQLSPSRQAWDGVHVARSRLWSGKLDEPVHGWPRGKPIGENAIDTKVGPTELNGRGRRPRLTVVDTVAFGWRNVISNQGAYNIKERVEAVFDRVTIHDSELAFRLRYPALVRIQNAVVYDVDWAFRLEGGLRNAQILSSTIGGGITRAPFRYAGGAPIGLTLKNLLFLAPAVPKPAETHPSNLAVDVNAFANSRAHDYRLAFDAPAIDTGESLQIVHQDRDGIARPKGEAQDIGAYEYRHASD